MYTRCPETSHKGAVNVQDAKHTRNPCHDASNEELEIFFVSKPHDSLQNVEKTIGPIQGITR